MGAYLGGPAVEVLGDELAARHVVVRTRQRRVPREGDLRWRDNVGLEVAVGVLHLGRPLHVLRHVHTRRLSRTRSLTTPHGGHMGDSDASKSI